jgi:hypothetical protein
MQVLRRVAAVRSQTGRSIGGGVSLERTVEREADDAELFEDDLDDVEQVAREASAADRNREEKHLPQGERPLDRDREEVCAVQHHSGRAARTTTARLDDSLTETRCER